MVYPIDSARKSVKEKISIFSIFAPLVEVLFNLLPPTFVFLSIQGYTEHYIVAYDE